MTTLQRYLLGARFALEDKLFVRLAPIESQIKETAEMIGVLECWQGGEFLCIGD